jgi:thioredoxin reductase
LYGNLFVADGNKETLVSVWETIIADTGVRVHTGEGVTAIRRNGARFVVESSKRAYTGRHVVLAVGKRGTPRRLGVSGEELSKVAYRLIEAESYTDCDLLVVGGGDSAVEAALALGRNRNRTTLCYRGRDFRRIRERNNTALQEAEAEGRVTVQRNTHVREIRSRSVLVDCGGSPAEIPNDYVFVLVGGESPEDFLQRTGVEIVEKVLSG